MVGGLPVCVVAPSATATSSRRLSPEATLWEKLRLEVLALCRLLVVPTLMVCVPPLSNVAKGELSVAKDVPFFCTVAVMPGVPGRLPEGTCT